MIKVLVVKLSSLGDVVHCLPALADAAQILDEIVFDWVVEEAFEAIPENCNHVRSVIPVALRRWRKTPWSPNVWKEFAGFRNRLREEEYDFVIDAQGLMKSALVARMSRGRVYGFDRNSAREPLSSLLYQIKIPVNPDEHAIERLRQLFACALSYAPDRKKSYDKNLISYALKNSAIAGKRQIFLLHGTTWSSKEWPIEYWIQLAKIVVEAGYEPCLTWGNELERQRCELIADNQAEICILPKMELKELIKELASMSGVIAVDTGLGHMSAALNLPVVSIYGSTDPLLTGIRGLNVSILTDQLLDCRPCRKKKCIYENIPNSGKIHPPCYESIKPEEVWRKLIAQMKSPCSQ